ncbi:hypothetical protein ACHAW6_004317 [Cyclotella cf. meneghiniana]
MSWKASLSRHLPIVRFFACPKSPASRGVFSWYQKNYEELKMLNPTMPLLLRCSDNAMPAITTELSFTTSHLLKYMLQKNKFQNTDGSPNEERREAAQKMLGYLADENLKKEYEVTRWNSPGFDPQRPFLDEDFPDWQSDPKISNDLKRYIEIHNELENTWALVTSGPNQEWTRGENALLMCQRVDLWCAGEAEVEAALKHLLNLGKECNDLVPDNPEYVTEFYPGASDL